VDHAGGVVVHRQAERPRAAGDEDEAVVGRVQDGPDLGAVAGVVQQEQHRLAVQQAAEAVSAFLSGHRYRAGVELRQQDAQCVVRRQRGARAEAAQVQGQLAVREVGRVAVCPVDRQAGLADARHAVQRHDLALRARRQDAVQVREQVRAAGEGLQVSGQVAWWRSAWWRRGAGVRLFAQDVVVDAAKFGTRRRADLGEQVGAEFLVEFQRRRVLAQTVEGAEVDAGQAFVEPVFPGQSAGLAHHLDEFAEFEPAVQESVLRGDAVEGLHLVTTMLDPRPVEFVQRTPLPQAQGVLEQCFGVVVVTGGGGHATRFRQYAETVVIDDFRGEFQSVRLAVVVDHAAGPRAAQDLAQAADQGLQPASNLGRRTVPPHRRSEPVERDGLSRAVEQQCENGSLLGGPEVDVIPIDV
jgi:hypothetical protein